MRGLLYTLLHVVVAVKNFSQTLVDARKKFPYDVLDMYLCPSPVCHFPWRMQFTQMYRNSMCVDLIPHGRRQFIMDIDHECRYEMMNLTFETSCDELMQMPPVDFIGFDHCFSALPNKVFKEDCTHMCKHGRPVSRCVYTVDPEDDYALADSLEGCHISGMCLCRDDDPSVCEAEARFIECYRTDEAIARLETEAELAQLQKSVGANASINDRYSALEHAYDQRTAQLNDLEEEHEEVSEQLEGALTALQAQRDKHRAEVASRTQLVSSRDALADQSIIAAERYSEVQLKLDAEIRARKAKEAELSRAKRRNNQLIVMLSVALLAVVGAVASACYYMKKKPTVLLVSATPDQEGGSGDGTAVQNTTVVMGREVPAHEAKASSMDADVLSAA
jgi:hypothetical protein